MKTVHFNNQVNVKEAYNLVNSKEWVKSVCRIWTILTLKSLKKTIRLSSTEKLTEGIWMPFQHLNNIVYFRYFETARIIYFDDSQLLSDLSAYQAIPVLTATECHYKRSITYPDTISIGSRVKIVRKNSICHEYEIFSHSQKNHNLCHSNHCHY